MHRIKAREIAQGGIIAALYVVLTLISHSFGLANGMIQIRVSEALCILPVFTGCAVPGLFAGCFLSNLITGCALPDVVFGSLATLLGAFGTRMLKDHGILSFLPPVAVNTIVVPILLSEVYGVRAAWPVLAACTFAGEAVSAGLLGFLLRSVLKKYRGQLFQ